MEECFLIGRKIIEKPDCAGGGEPDDGGIQYRERYTAWLVGMRQGEKAYR